MTKQPPVFPDLDEYQRFIFDWQYGYHGDFRKALCQAFMYADTTNLLRLSTGFPMEAQAFEMFWHVNNWWQDVDVKVQKYFREADAYALEQRRQQEKNNNGKTGK
jgi:hypothetical protein